MGYFWRFVKYFFAPIFLRINNYRMFYPYRKNFDSSIIPWNWDLDYNRIAIINLVLSKFREPSYLEIGCDKNQTFSSIPCDKKIGIDPKSGGNFRGTSNQFFQQNTTLFDVVFIDGLHTYEQCREDFINSLKFSKVGSWIVIHDLLPNSWIEQHVPPLRLGGAWTGDVWKLAFELANTEGIEFRILELDHGVGVCRVDKLNVKLNNRYEELMQKNFDFFKANYKSLPVINVNEFKKIFN
jgi:hypothetical protein